MWTCVRTVSHITFENSHQSDTYLFAHRKLGDGNFICQDCVCSDYDDPTNFLAKKSFRKGKWWIHAIVINN